MGILTDVYIASPNDALRYDTDPASFQDVTLSAKTITDLELSMLWAIFRGEPWDIKFLKDFEHLLSRDDGERLIIALPESLLGYLAQADVSKLATVAQAWGKTEEMARYAESVPEYLANLAALAKRALSSGQRLYLWVCV